MSNLSKLRYSLTVIVTNLVLSVKRLSALEWQKHQWSQMVHYPITTMQNVEYAYQKIYKSHDVSNIDLPGYTCNRFKCTIYNSYPTHKYKVHKRCEHTSLYTIYRGSQSGNKHCVAICKCYQFLAHPPSLTHNPMPAGQV